jgi:4'-phosphopantetheinyl transferase
VTWTRPPCRATLAGGDVHVWRAWLDIEPRLLTRLGAVLAPDELARAQRYRRPRDRARFVAARGILRHLAARYVVARPREIRFDANAWGKPRLAWPAGPMFNVSHADGLALYAWARRHVGIDVERVRADFDSAPLAAFVLSARERTVLAHVPHSQRTETFFVAWTRKEAVVKASGRGLSVPVDTIDVLPREEPVRVVSAGADGTPAWSVVDITPGPDLVAAVAVEDHHPRLHCFDFDSEDA